MRRQLSATEFSVIESRIDRALAHFIHRQNELDGLDAALKGQPKMTAKLKSLRGNLKNIVDRLNDHAAASEQAVMSAAGRAEGAIAKTNDLGKEINQAAADIEAMVGVESNNPPE